MYLKLFSNTQYTKIDFFQDFFILKMLGFVTYVFGHQEPIAAISLT